MTSATDVAAGPGHGSVTRAVEADAAEALAIGLQGTTTLLDPGGEVVLRHGPTHAGPALLSPVTTAHERGPSPLVAAGTAG